MVHKLIRKLVAVTSLLMLSASAFAELVVIVHPSNDSALDAKKVQRIFLGKEKKFSNGAAVVPLNQVTNDLRSQFDSNVLGRKLNPSICLLVKTGVHWQRYPTKRTGK